MPLPDPGQSASPVCVRCDGSGVNRGRTCGRCGGVGSPMPKCGSDERVAYHQPRCDIREISVGNVHATRGDAAKVAEFHAWLMANPNDDLPSIDVFPKPNGTFRIHDGRHRFLAYVLAERATIPIEEHR